MLLALQRTAIHDAQGYILAELAGTRFKVMRLYRSIPGIALRVGVDASKNIGKIAGGNQCRCGSSGNYSALENALSYFAKQTSG